MKDKKDNIIEKVFYDDIEKINRDSTFNAQKRFSEGTTISKKDAVLGFIYFFLKRFCSESKYRSRLVSGLFSGLEEFLTRLKLLKLKGDL